MKIIMNLRHATQTLAAAVTCARFQLRISAVATHASAPATVQSHTERKYRRQLSKLKNLLLLIIISNRCGYPKGFLKDHIQALLFCFVLFTITISTHCLLTVHTQWYQHYPTILVHSLTHCAACVAANMLAWQCRLLEPLKNALTCATAAANPQSPSPCRLRPADPPPTPFCHFHHPLCETNAQGVGGCVCCSRGAC